MAARVAENNGGSAGAKKQAGWSGGGAKMGRACLAGSGMAAGGWVGGRGGGMMRLGLQLIKAGLHEAAATAAVGSNAHGKCRMRGTARGGARARAARGSKAGPARA